MGTGVGYDEDGECINDYDEQSFSADIITVTYVTNDDCSSTFTELSVDGTTTIYSTDARGNIEIIQAMETVVITESTSPCEYSIEETSDSGWVTTI